MKTTMCILFLLGLLLWNTAALGDAEASLTGRLVLEGTDIPVADARIAITTSRKTAEAITDEQGRFTVDQVPTGQGLKVSIEAKDEKSHRFNFAGVTHQLPIPESKKTHDVKWSIQAKRLLTVDQPFKELDDSGGYPSISAELMSDNGAWYPGPVLNMEPDPSGATRLIVSYPGVWRVVLHDGLWLARYSKPIKVGAEDFSAKAALLVAGKEREQVEILLSAVDGRPFSNAVVRVSTPMPGMDPVALRTDEAGILRLGPVNVARVNLTVDSEAGYFEGPVEFDEKDQVQVTVRRDR